MRDNELAGKGNYELGIRGGIDHTDTTKVLAQLHGGPLITPQAGLDEMADEYPEIPGHDGRELAEHTAAWSAEGEDVAMSSDLSDFWHARRRHLANNYVDASGEHGESCSMLAIQIARLLRAEGKNPSILSLTGVRVDTKGILIYKSLVPRPYDGRVTWGGHVICIAGDMVYDPMLERPEPWVGYPYAAFGEDILTTDLTSWLLDEE